MPSLYTLNSPVYGIINMCCHGERVGHTVDENWETADAKHEIAMCWCVAFLTVKLQQISEKVKWEGGQTVI